MFHRFSLFAVLFLALFFASTCVRSSWKVIISSEGDFSVVIPGDPQSMIEKGNRDKGTYDTTTYMVNRRNETYAVSYYDIPSAVLKKIPLEKILDRARDLLVQKVGPVVSEERMLLGKHPGRKLRTVPMQGESYCHVQMILVGDRLYQLMATIPMKKKDTEEMTKFFTSFKLLRE